VEKFRECRLTDVEESVFRKANNFNTMIAGRSAVLDNGNVTNENSIQNVIYVLTSFLTCNINCQCCYISRES